MEEWGVVGVIVVLVGLVASIVKPLVSLTNTITRLTVVVDTLQKDTAGLTASNREAHQRLWAYNGEQDKIISNHEGRIVNLEHRKEKPNEF